MTVHLQHTKLPSLPGPQLQPLDTFGALWDAAITLGIAVLVAWVVAWFVRRQRARQTGGPNARLALVETLPLGPRRFVHVVRLDGDGELILGSSDAGVSLLQHRAASSRATDGASDDPRGCPMMREGG